MNTHSVAAGTYVILTSKPGQYHTEATEGIVPLAAYDYVYCGRHIATFVIAALAKETKIRVIDEATPSAVNLVPTKFLEKFTTHEAALESLRQLAGHGNSAAQLTPR
jgi:hypothetical protein